MSLRSTLIKTLPNSGFTDEELAVLREIAGIAPRCCGDHHPKLEGRFTLFYQPKTDPDFTTKAIGVLVFDLSENGRSIGMLTEMSRLQPFEAEHGRYRLEFASSISEVDETALGIIVAAFSDTLAILRPDDKLLLEQVKTYRSKCNVVVDIRNLFSRAKSEPTTPFRALREWAELTKTFPF